MKIFLTLLFLVFSAFPAVAEEKESAYDRVMRTNTLKVGYFVWPPYIIKDPNTDAISGLGADFIDIVAKLLDVKIEWIEMTGLGTQIEGFKQGRYDVIINDGPYVFSAIKFINFSDPLLYAPVYAYVRSDDKRFSSPEQLNSPEVTFVGLDGDLSVDLARRIFTKARLDTLPASTDPGILMTNVVTKKGDVVIIDPGSIVTFNKNNNLGLTAITSTPIAVYPLGFSMIKDDSKLLTMINGVVAAMHNTNAVEPILKKWFPEKDSYFLVAKPYEISK